MNEVIEIPLTKGLTAVVDSADADLSNQKWQAIKKRGRYYAARHTSRRIDKTRKLIYLHKVVLERKLGTSIGSGERVDHKDNNPLNNRRENLRRALPSQNSQNQKLRTDNSTGYKGVSREGRTGKYYAQITVKGKKHHLGTADTPQDASKLYAEASALYHQEFGRTH